MTLSITLSRILENQYTWNIALLVVVAGMLFYTKQILNRESTLKPYWYLMLVYLFLVRSNDFNQLWTLNQDEEQWIMCARSMSHEPITWFKQFMALDYTRFFTILPLAIVVFITNSAGYFQARLVQILLTFLFLRLGYSAVSKMFGKKEALIATSMFATFVGMSRNADIIAYNSEISASILFMLFLVQLIRYLKNEELKYSLFLAGIFLGFMPFAKEQSLLIAVGSGASLLAILVLNKEFKHAYKLCLGGISGFLFIFIPVIVQNGHELIFGLFHNMIQYSNQGLLLESNGENPYSLNVFLKSYFLNKEYLPFTIALIFSIPIIGKSLMTYKSSLGRLHLVVLCGFILAIYSIYKPGNNFFHYSILLWPFLFLFVALVISKSKIILTYFWVPAALVILCQIHDLRFRHIIPIQYVFSAQNLPLDEVQQTIEMNSIETDRILVWGWNNKYYTFPERERGCSFLYPKFALGEYEGKSLVINQYLIDLNLLKPKIIIEAIGEDQFDMKDYKTQSITAVSDNLGKVLKENYNKVYSKGSYQIYILKTDDMMVQ